MRELCNIAWACTGASISTGCYMKLSLGRKKLVLSWMLQHGPELDAISLGVYFGWDSTPGTPSDTLNSPG